MLRLWLILSAVRLITAILDCGYVANPSLKIQCDTYVLEMNLDGPIPLNVCSTNNQSFGSGLTIAYKYSCDNSQVILNAWEGKDCDDINSTPLESCTVEGESRTDEFNCNSQNECDYLYYKRTKYLLSTNCNASESALTEFVTDNVAFITDMCITTTEGSIMYSSCDLSDSPTKLSYNSSTDCSDTPSEIEEYISDGSCRSSSDLPESYLTEAIACPTTNPTNTPTNNPTNVPTMDSVESESINSGSVESSSAESADNAYMDKQQNDISRFTAYDYERDVEIEFGPRTLLNFWFLCGMCVLMLIGNVGLYCFNNQY